MHAVPGLAALALAAALARGPAPRPAEPAPPGPAPMTATPGVQAIDGRRSSARFVVRTRVRGSTSGRLGGVSGELRDASGGGATVHVRIDARTLRLEGPRWMERATRSPAFLAVDQHPELRFDSTRFDPALLRRGGPLQGELALRGEAHPVAFELLPADCAQPGRDCDIQVHGYLSRREFGMVAYRHLLADQVELHIRVRLRLPPAAAGGAP